MLGELAGGLALASAMRVQVERLQERPIHEVVGGEDASGGVHVSERPQSEDALQELDQRSATAQDGVVAGEEVRERVARQGEQPGDLVRVLETGSPRLRRICLVMGLRELSRGSSCPIEPMMSCAPRRGWSETAAECSSVRSKRLAKE